MTHTQRFWIYSKKQKKEIIVIDGYADNAGSKTFSINKIEDEVVANFLMQEVDKIS